MPPEDSLLEAREGTFARGVSEYADARPGMEEPLARIYIPFQPAGTDIWHLALVDTGGHFFIPSPEVLAAIRERLTDSFDRTSLMTARGRIHGELYRHQLALISITGEDLDVDATVFVSPEWDGPSVFGYTGMLERIRFAVDPATNLFYFGPRP